MSMQKRRSLFPVAAGACVLGAAAVGCESGPRNVETGGANSLVTMGIDAGDIESVVNDLLASMLETGVLSKAEHSPARISIERIVNDTSQRFPIEAIEDAMREQLVNSGLAQVIMTKESREVREGAKREQFISGGAANIQPDFILIGKIFQLESRQGKNVERTYYVSLKLAFAAGENRNLEAWTKRSSFTTQGRKSDLAL